VDLEVPGASADELDDDMYERIEATG
jgi:hypothetical protein